MLFDSLAIVGVGLIGGSIGLAAKNRHVARHVIGIGRNEASLAKARTLGAIDEFSTDLKSAVRSVDAVLVCSPVDRIAVQILEAAAEAKAGTLFSDAGSTKANIVRDVESHLPEQMLFVGAHPLAGSEKQGVEFARADLFLNRVCVLTPTQKTPVEAVERCSTFWRSIGSSVKTLSPEEHDLALATTSHLPHFIAALLSEQLPERWRSFAATGFRDTTRIAAGDPALWSAIAEANALALSHALDEFSQRLERLKLAVLQQDTEELTRLLSDAKKVRDALGS